MTATLLEFPPRKVVLGSKCASCSKKMRVKWTEVKRYCSYSCGLAGQPQHSKLFLGTYSHEE